LDEKEGRKFSENDVRRIIFQIVNGLRFIHSNNIIHRDIKLENIIYNPKQNTCKIIDFGISYNQNMLI
jgi:serine/threonine protein kinase